MTERDKMGLDVALGMIFDGLIRGIHTAMIAKVTAFDADRRTISAQPVLKRLFEGSDAPVLLPICEDVPVVFLGGGDMIVEVDISIDSYVLLICSERSIEKWLSSGGIVDPGSSRAFDLSDAIAISGLFSFADPVSPGVEPKSITLRKRDGTVFFRVKEDGTIRGENPAGFFELNGSTGQVNINDNWTVDP